MFVTSLVLGLVGVFCILDSRILGRLNFERPLITCTIVGLLLGNLPVGLTVGASVELMSLGIVNIGAAAPPDMNMAAIICSAFAILTDASVETSLALAIPIAVLGVLMRTILSNLTHVADHAIEEGKFARARNMHIIWGMPTMQRRKSTEIAAAMNNAANIFIEHLPAFGRRCPATFLFFAVPVMICEGPAEMSAK